MDEHDLELALRLLARADPPPILYRYRRPHEWTLAEIAEQRIHLTAPDDQNDPFESRAPVIWDAGSLRKTFEDYARKVGLSQAQSNQEFDTNFTPSLFKKLEASQEETRKDSGMICLSSNPNSIRMWSYYAQSHEGVCLGFDTTRLPFYAALKVKYQNPEKPIDIAAAIAIDSTQLADHISLRKAAEWEFEQEYRVIIGQIKNNPRLVPFDPLALREIRFGAKVKDDFRDKVLAAVTKLPKPPKLIQMKCDFDRFVLVEETLTT